MRPGGSTTEPAGVYVHVPFCSAVCPYCDFAVLRDDRGKHGRFVAALGRELAMRHQEARGLGVVDTVYFGGGTPSILGVDALAEVLDAIGEATTLAGDTRIFLEANPEDIDRPRLDAWRDLGVRFLSLGVQALDDQALGFLGRRHTASEAVRAIEAALGAGFDTVSVDLIYGLPDQHPTAWRHTLEPVAALGPQHISCYQLTIEPRTPFARRVERGALLPAPDADQARLFLLTHEILAGNGYDGYEVSNFARGAEHRSRHNRKYWRHVPYLGVGPSAHSFDGRRRRWNERHLARWQRRVEADDDPAAGDELLTDGQLAFEALMLGLRTADGVDLAGCERRCGVDLRRGNGERIERLEAAGRLRDEGRRLVPTLQGMAIADAIAASWPVDVHDNLEPS